MTSSRDKSLVFNEVAGLRTAILSKRDSGTCVSRRFLRKFSEHLFYWRPPAPTSYCPIEIEKQPPEEFYEKKVFLEISQNSHENTYARVS